MTDWHLDLDYIEGTVRQKCGQELCCHSVNGMASEGQGARKFGEVIGCDIPLVTCRAQMQWLKENLRGELQPDLILWTGDNVSHDMQHMTEEKVIETLQVLTDLIKEFYPDVPLVAILGNHDFEPANY